MQIQAHAAIVTGGASGLGEATARELARLGARVAILDVNTALAEQVAADIGGIACHCDITSTDSVSAALARAAGVDRRIDRWSWVSLYHALGVVQAGVFGIEQRPRALVPPALALAAVSTLSLAVLARRADSPIRA